MLWASNSCTEWKHSFWIVGGVTCDARGNLEDLLGILSLCMLREKWQETWNLTNSYMHAVGGIIPHCLNKINIVFSRRT
jgi:hypothetical protein